MTIPRITHGQAEGVGQELAAYLMERGQLLDMDDLSWADAVQFVLRRSAEVQADAEERAGHAAEGGASATAGQQRAQRSCASSEDKGAEAPAEE